ncbi:MAG: hypothetical protein FWC80_03975 [Firmicutes bacterium]|nr:hypothetical protein [Bacillota bacterium]
MKKRMLLLCLIPFFGSVFPHFIIDKRLKRLFGRSTGVLSWSLGRTFLLTLAWFLNFAVIAFIFLAIGNVLGDEHIVYMLLWVICLSPLTSGPAIIYFVHADKVVKKHQAEVDAKKPKASNMWDNIKKITEQHNTEQYDDKKDIE